MLVHYEDKLCSVSSAAKVEAVYSLPAGRAWYIGHPWPPNRHQYAGHATLTTALIEIFNAMLDAWPGAPAVDRSVFVRKPVASPLHEESYVECWSGGTRRILTAGEWSRRAGQDVHFADYVEGRWVIANSAWMSP